MEMQIVREAGLAEGADMRSQLQSEKEQGRHGHEGAEGDPEGFGAEVQGAQGGFHGEGLLPSNGIMIRGFDGRGLKQRG